MTEHQEMWIAGHPIGGPCDRGVGKEVVRSPWDGSVVGTVAEGGLSELRTCVASAHDAFATWRKSAPEDRSALLARVAGLIDERADYLAELLSNEVAKPITMARAEVSRTARTFRVFSSLPLTYGDEPNDLYGDPRGAGLTATVCRVPLGVVLAIVPYNWPLNLAAHKIAPALATGNTLVVKPSHQAPLSTLALVRLIHEAGVPDGVLNAWNGAPKLAEKILVEDKRIKKLSFTGSPKIGWYLKGLVPDRRVTLELGGNATVILSPDFDPNACAQAIATSAFGFAGQVCISTQHVWAHADRFEETCAALAAATQATAFGDPSDPATICGPLITEEAAIKVSARIDEAIAAGAKILAGGTREGNRIPPTLLTVPTKPTELMTEEIFGPVMTVGSYRTWEEVRERVNGSAYGIHAALYSRDEALIAKAEDELEVGGVVINDTPSLRFDGLPYGGVRRSGFGREGGRAAMDEMTEPKVTMRRG